MLNGLAFGSYTCKTFLFEGRDCIIVFPDTSDENRNWIIKTEYWSAFPDTEKAFLKRGFHLLFMGNTNRWATPEDCHARARFAKFVAEHYHLREKCVPIGMSCGGAHAVNFAGLHPECIASMYLDAPVLNFCSCPAYLGKKDMLCNSWENEFVLAYPGITKGQLLNFPWHPINRLPELIANRIPVAISYGTEDQTVPYAENGQLLTEAYEKTDIPFLAVPRDWQGHHPHGLADPAPIVEFIVENML